MHENQRVSEMAGGVLSRQAAFRAGKYLEELRSGPHRDERAEQWQAESARKRTKERSQARQEECKRLERGAAWKQFMQTELRELELRKGG